MADDLNENLGYKGTDDEISLVTRGASVAGLITAGLGFPSLWRTLKRYFPKGTVDSATARYIPGRGPNEIEIATTISRAAFETYSDPERLAEIYTAAAEVSKKQKAIVEEAERQTFRAQRAYREALDARKLEQDLRREAIESAAKEEGINEVTRRIRVTEDALTDRASQSGIAYRRKRGYTAMPGMSKEELLREVRRASIVDHLEDKQLTAVYRAQGAEAGELARRVLDDPKVLSNKTVDALFERMVEGRYDDKDFARKYLARLQGRRLRDVVADAYELDTSVPLARDIDLLRPRRRPKRAVLVDPAAFEKFTPKSLFKVDIDPHGKLGLAEAEKMLKSYDLVDNFAKNVIGENPWLGKGNYFKGTNQALREVARAFQDEVNAYNMTTKQGQVGDLMGFTMEMSYADRASKFPQVEVNLKRAGSEPYKIILPLPNEGRAVMPPGHVAGMTSWIPDRKWTNQPVKIQNSAVSFLTYAKQTAKKFVNDFRAGWRGDYGNLANLQRTLIEAYNLEPMEGLWYRNVHKSEKIHFDLTHQMMSKGKSSLGRRIRGLEDWRIYEMHKRLGRDIVVYDQEYYLRDPRGGTAAWGPQITKRHPEKAFPWQWSWRRMKADGSVSHGTIYIKTRELERDLAAGNYGTGAGKAFKESLDQIRQVDKLKYYSDQIMSKGVYEAEAMRLIEGRVNDALVIDQFGGRGADRAILNQRANTYLGRSVIKEGMAADLMEMRKYLSPNTYGFGLEQILADTVRSASDKDLNVAVKMLTHGDDKGNAPHAKFIRNLKEQIRLDPKSRREIIIKAFQAGAHDANVDVAATTTSLWLMRKYNPLMGRSGTAYAAKEAFMRSGYMSAEQTIYNMNRWVMARHFMGEQGASDGLDANYFNYSPTDVSQSALLRGVGNRLPGYYFNPWSIDNSLRKQTAQMFHGIPLFLPNDAGRMKYPFSIVNEITKEKLTSGSVADNINRNAKPTLLKTAFVPKGTFTPDSIAYIDKSVSRALYGVFGAKNAPVTMSGLVDGAGVEFLDVLRKVYNDAEKEAGKGAAGDPRRIQQFIDRKLKKVNQEILKLHETIQTSSGEVARKARETLASKYIIKQDTSLAQVVGKHKDILKYNYFQPGRLVNLENILKESGVFETAVEYERFVSMDRGLPMKMMFGESDKATPTEVKISNILRPTTNPEQIIEGEFAKNHRQRPIEAIVTMNALGREELGTVKRRQFMRIWGNLHAMGDKTQMREFLYDVFSHGTLHADRHGHMRLDTKIATVDDALRVTNNMSADKMYHWMKNAQILWDSKSINKMGSWYGVKYASDWKEHARSFDKVYERELDQLKKRTSRLKTAAKAGVGTSVEVQIDEETTRYVRSRINPYFDYHKRELVNARDPKKSPVARFWDFGDDVTGKRVGIPMIIAWEGIHANVAYEVQNKPLANQRFYSPAFIVEEQMSIWHGFDNDTTKKLMGRHKGAFRRKAADRMRRLATAVISGNLATKAKDDYIREISGLNDVILGIRNFRKYNAIARDQVDRVKFERGGFAEHLQTTVADLEEDLRHKEEVLKRPGLKGENKAYFKNEVSKLKKHIKGLEVVKKTTDVSAQYDITNNAGTLWEYIERDQSTGSLREDQRIIFGKQGGKEVKLAPYDMIMLKTKGFSPLDDKEFFDKVIKKAEELARSEDRSIGTFSHELRKQIDFVRDSMKRKPKDAMLLTSPSLFMDVMGIGYFEADNVMNLRNNKLRLYENVLTAYNDYVHGKSVDINRTRLSEAYSSYLANIFTKSIGKKGVLTEETHYSFSGQYGTAISQEALLKQAQDGWLEFTGGGGRKQAIENLRRKYGKRRGLHGKELTKYAEEVYNKNVRALQLLKDPTSNFITKADLKKYQVNGMPVQDWFMKYVEGDLTKKQELWKRILRGEAPMLDYTARSPMRTHPWGMNAIKTWVVDPSLEIFNNRKVLHDGLFMSTIYFKMMGGDFDGDTAQRMMINFQSLAGYDKVAKAVHDRDKKVGQIMSDFWEVWGKKSRTPGVKNAFKAARDVMLKRADISSVDAIAIDYAKDIAEENGKFVRRVAASEMLEKGMTSGYELANIQNMDRVRLMLNDTMTESVDLIERFTKGETARDFMKRQQQAAATLNTAGKVIGEISSMSTQFDLKMKQLRQFLFKDARKDEVTQLLNVFKYFPGDVGKDTATKTIEKEMEYVFRGEKAFDLLTKSISAKARGIAQTAISGKKQAGEGADIALINLMKAWKSLRLPESRKIFSTISAETFTQPELAFLGSFDIMDNIMKKNPYYARKLRTDYSRYSHRGWVLQNVVEDVLEKVSGGMMDNASSEVKKRYAEEYWGIYGVGRESFVKKSSQAWGNSIKQMLAGKSRDKGREFIRSLDFMGDKFAGMKKFIYEHNVGKKGKYTLAALGLLTFLSPNQLSGGPGDAFMDLGHRPGRGGEYADIFGFNALPKGTLNPEHGKDPYTEKWVHLVKDNPQLNDKMSNLSIKKYRDLQPRQRRNAPYYGQQAAGKRRYINRQSTYSNRYVTNDQRRANIPGF